MMLARKKKKQEQRLQAGQEMRPVRQEMRDQYHHEDDQSEVDDIDDSVQGGFDRFAGYEDVNARE